MEFLTTIPDAPAEVSEPLKSHQRLFNLVMNKKVLYIKLVYEDVIDRATNNFKAHMIVVLKDFEFSSMDKAL